MTQGGGGREEKTRETSKDREKKARATARKQIKSARDRRDEKLAREKALRAEKRGDYQWTVGRAMKKASGRRYSIKPINTNRAVKRHATFNITGKHRNAEFCRV